MSADLERLAAVLDAADQAHAAEIEALAELDDDQLTYLARAGDRRDGSTDHLEGRCV